MTSDIKHVAILMGGMSAEREVSFLSGKMMQKAVEELGYRVTVIDPDRTLAAKLEAVKPDLVLNALHGTYGEDGAIPGMLEMMGIPYTHSGVMASAIGMNKKLTREIAASRGVKVAPGKVVTVEEVIEAVNSGVDLFPRPYVLKPVQEGSSLGVYIIKGETKLEFDPNTWNYGEQLLVEQYIPGQELSAAYVGTRAIGMLEIRQKAEFLDYRSKYTENLSEHIFPAPVPEEIYKKALKYAEVVHEALGCRVISRSDFRYNAAEGSEGLYFLEINTHPGMTQYSIAPDILKGCGLSNKELVEMLIKDAKSRK